MSANGVAPMLPMASAQLAVAERRVGEGVAVDEDILQSGAVREVVGVDVGAAAGAGVRVVDEQIVLDDGLNGRADVRDEDADDVVLDDVVDDVRAGRPRLHPDGRAEVVHVRLALNREAVDRDVVGVDDELRVAGGVRVHHGFAAGPGGAGVDFGLGSVESELLADSGAAGVRPCLDVDGVAWSSRRRRRRAGCSKRRQADRRPRSCSASRRPYGHLCEPSRIPRRRPRRRSCRRWRIAAPWSQRKRRCR